MHGWDTIGQSNKIEATTTCARLPLSFVTHTTVFGYNLGPDLDPKFAKPEIMVAAMGNQK
jgi:hypothetical protein